MPKGCWYVLRRSDGAAVAQSERRTDAEAVAEAMGTAFKVESSHAGAHWLRWDDELQAADAEVSHTNEALCTALDDLSGDQIEIELVRQHPARTDYLRARRFLQRIDSERTSANSPTADVADAAGSSDSVGSARFNHFHPSTDPRATSCPAWKSLMQLRHELLTNPRQDSGTSGWWSKWIGSVHHNLYGGGDWGVGYYGPDYPLTTPACAIALSEAKGNRARLMGKNPSRGAGHEAGDFQRSVLFLPDATYFHSGFVIDWAQPFPAIHDRARIVEWIEAWIDRVTFAEVTGRNPWEEEPQGALSPTQLEELGRKAAEAAAPDLIDRAATSAAEKAVALFAGGPNNKPNPHPSTTVVLWPGADHSPHNIKLARTRSAYEEAHGNVAEALKALEESGNRMARSTFYNHLDELDMAIPEWRKRFQLSNQNGNLDGMNIPRKRRKSRDNER